MSTDPSNPYHPRNVLRAAVSLCISKGAPVYVNQPAKPKHTAEPWKLAPSAADSILGSDGIRVASCPYGFQSDFANAARIVECINACAGMEDPAEALRLVLIALKAGEVCQSDYLRDACAKALRALGG